MYVSPSCFVFVFSIFLRSCHSYFFYSFLSCYSVVCSTVLHGFFKNLFCLYLTPNQYRSFFCHVCYRFSTVLLRFFTPCFEYFCHTLLKFFYLMIISCSSSCLGFLFFFSSVCPYYRFSLFLSSFCSCLQVMFLFSF